MEQLDDDKLEEDIEYEKERAFAEPGQWLIANLIGMLIMEVRGLRQDLRGKK